MCLPLSDTSSTALPSAASRLPSRPLCQQHGLSANGRAPCLTAPAGRAAANPAPEWLLDRAWRELSKLARLPAFAGIDAAVAADPGAWRGLYESETPHRAPLPGHFSTLDTFRKLLVTRVMRPDKVTVAVADYIEAHLGRQFVEPPTFRLDACYGDSAATVPLIFVLSAGSDPTAALLQFAAEQEMDGRLAAISLGQGQGPKAARLIEEGVTAGNWVVLQNCHLAPSWMPALDAICEALRPESTHPAFRLWMTSYPSPAFPVNILQNGVKMTNEPPKGVRANMLRSFTLEPAASDAFFDGAARPAAFKRLLYALVFFHAVVQERRTFGPLGWNIPYGFDDGDWRISARQLLMFCNENEVPPLAALRYVTGECNYGGRVTDDKDRRLLATLLERCYAPELLTAEAYGLSESGVYSAGWGDDAARADMTTALAALPSVPAPETFGLHSNAAITKDQNATAALFAALLQAGGASGGGAGGGGTEARVAAVVAAARARLPDEFDITAAGRRFPVVYEESMNTVRPPACLPACLSACRPPAHAVSQPVSTELPPCARTEPSEPRRHAELRIGAAPPVATAVECAGARARDGALQPAAGRRAREPARHGPGAARPARHVLRPRGRLPEPGRQPAAGHVGQGELPVAQAARLLLGRPLRALGHAAVLVRPCRPLRLWPRPVAWPGLGAAVRRAPVATARPRRTARSLGGGTWNVGTQRRAWCGGNTLPVFRRWSAGSHMPGMRPLRALLCCQCLEMYAFGERKTWWL